MFILISHKQCKDVCFVDKICYECQIVVCMASIYAENLRSVRYFLISDYVVYV